jgi:hypothetical protein
MTTEFKLSKQTRAYLDNFSKINNSIIFRPGTALATVSKDEDVIARAKITDNIPDRFAIHDVSKFLSILNLYDDAAITVNDKTLTIKNGKAQKFNFTLGAEKGITTTEKDKTELPPVVAEFHLSAADLISLKKNLLTGGLNTVVFFSNGKTLGVKAMNIGEQTSNEYDAVLRETSGKKFSVAFSDSKITNMLEFDYEVSITDKIVRFKSDNVEYYLPPLKGSKTG